MQKIYSMQRNNRPGKATGTGRSSRPDDKSSRKSSRPQLKDRKFGKPEEKKRNNSRGYSDNEREDTRPKRTFERREGDDTRPKRTFERREGNDTRPKRTFDRRDGDDTRPKRTFERREGDDTRPKRTFDRREGDDTRPKRTFDRRDGDDTRPKRTFDRRDGDDTHPKRIFERREGDDTRPKRAFDKKEGGYDKKSSKPYNKDKKYQSSDKSFTKKRASTSSRPSTPNDDGLIRLNKYLSNSGIASRREADELILAGAVMVNGVVVSELGTKISPNDKVQYGGDTIRKEKLRYVLLNKPKGYITTTDDPFDRNTVMTLVSEACKERIYPVGRLDRNTSGLLLFTNDGELAKKLTHPSHKVKKVYHVELDKALTKADMLKIAEGVELDDGIAFVDEIQYAEEGKSKREIGVELHSGRNRIVRRIFEAMGYEVVKLDRVVFAGLTKKDLPRAHWRLLTEKEVNFLQMIR